VNILKIVFRTLFKAIISALEALLAVVRNLNEWAKENSLPFFLGLGAILLGFLFLLRACADDTNDAASVATIETTTEVSTTTTTIVLSTTTSTVQLPTTTVDVAAPVLIPVKTTTTVNAPTRTTTTTVAPTTTVAATTTVAPSTTATPSTTAATTTTTVPPTTTTTIAPRTVTFTFVDEMWSENDKETTVTNIASLTSTEATWVKALPNGTARFTFRMYLYHNYRPFYPYLTRLTNVVGATCVDDGAQLASYRKTTAPAFAPDTNSYVTVTCDATGTGSISIPLTYVPPPSR
jgi:hypothetical protein